MSGTPRALLAAGRIGFRHHLAYKSEVLLQLLSASLVAALNGALWTAAATARPVIAGEAGESWRGLVLVSWVGVAAVATRVHEDIGGRFRDGQIAADLLRPVSLQAGTWARDAGRALACLLVGSAPLLVLVSLAIPLDLPRDPLTWALWACSLALAHWTNFGISFLLGLAAARLRNVVGLSYLKATLVSLLSGALLPLELLPPLARDIAFALPFHTMARSPAALLLGREPALPLLAEQLAWGLVLWGLGALGWRRVARGLTLEGG